MSVMAENAGNAPNHSLLYAHHDDIFLICGVFMSASIWDIHYSLFILSESHSPLILTGAILFRMNRLYVCTHVWTMNTTVHEKAFPPCLLLLTTHARSLSHCITYPTNMFWLCVVGLPAGSGAAAAAYLCPAGHCPTNIAPAARRWAASG